MPDDAPELTEEEQALIAKHLDFYHALATARRKPWTARQRHFVAVCEGKAEPETPHEKAYLKHLRYESRHRPQPRDESLPDLSDSRGEWCSRKDWKRMRAGNYGDMMKRHRGD